MQQRSAKPFWSALPERASEFPTTVLRRPQSTGRQGGTLASRASTWPRDHFCRSTDGAARIGANDVERVLADIDADHAIAVLSVWDMTCSLSLAPLCQLRLLAGQEQRPDHHISGHRRWSCLVSSSG
jgi:hypothetical protein